MLRMELRIDSMHGSAVIWREGTEKMMKRNLLLLGNIARLFLNDKNVIIKVKALTQSDTEAERRYDRFCDWLDFDGDCRCGWRCVSLV